MVKYIISAKYKKRKVVTHHNKKSTAEKRKAFLKRNLPKSTKVSMYKV